MYYFLSGPLTSILPYNSVKGVIFLKWKSDLLSPCFSYNDFIIFLREVKNPWYGQLGCPELASSSISQYVNYFLDLTMIPKVPLLPVGLRM